MSDDIVERLSLVRRTFPVAVNLGAHTGALSRRLRQLPTPPDLVVDVDTSAGMLAACDGPGVLGDEEYLPFRAQSVDLVVSALSLQLVNDLPGVLVQVRQALKPDGLLIAAMLGAGSLHELREALLFAETELTGGAAPRVAPFADVRELGALLQRAGFALPVADVDTLRVTYDDPLVLMADLRAMGVANALGQRSRRPLTRRVLARAIEIYRARHGDGKNRIAATFEIVTLTGWAPHPSQQQPLAPGSARMGLGEALGRSAGRDEA